MNGIAISTRQETVYKVIYKRKFNIENRAMLAEKIRHANWEHVLTENDCHKKWEKLTIGFQEALEEACPMKRIKVSYDIIQPHI